MKNLRSLFREYVRWPIEDYFLYPLQNHLVLPVKHFVRREVFRPFCLRMVEDLEEETQRPTLPDVFYPTTENLIRLFEIEDTVRDLNSLARRSRIS